ncbi:MAG: glycosyltransferase family 2 protein [Halobacteriota archaeon]
MTPEFVLVWLFAAFSIFVVGYYVMVNGLYAGIHVAGLFELQRQKREAEWNPPYEPFSSPFLPGIAVVVPAYNEAPTIIESVQALLTLEYSDTEIVVVNDGSTDGTLERLIERYDLQRVEATPPFELPCEPVRGIYRSPDEEGLVVIDKQNGGKADALNAGVGYTEKRLFCAIDADTIIEHGALLEIVRPFLRSPRRTVASGGTIRVANECEVEKGRIQAVDLSWNPLISVQVMEYLRAFYSGRLGLSRLEGLIIISGAFGLFRTDLVREVGGYRTESVTEDLDLVIAIHKHLLERDFEYQVTFLPRPVAWTEAPESLAQLGAQRRRWYRGLVDSLVTYRGMIGRRKYGRVGTFALPFFALAEALGPLIEGAGYVLIPVAVLLGILNVEFFLLFFLVTSGVGILLSWFGVYSEVWTYNRYERPRQIVGLLLSAVAENVGYRQWKTLQAWRGLAQYVRGEHEWGEMTRKGFDVRSSEDLEANTDDD